MGPHGRTVWLALALGAIAAPAAADKPELSAADVAKINRGETIVRALTPSGDSGIAALAVASVDAAPAEVWPVLRDCQHFHEFMPRTERSELRGRKGDESICFIEIHMPFPLSNLLSEVLSKESRLPDGGYSRAWSLRKGNYKKNTGSWTIHPWGDAGQRSLLVYRVDTEPDIMIPDAIQRRAQKGSLADMFEAIRKRVRSLRR